MGACRATATQWAQRLDPPSRRHSYRSGAVSHRAPPRRGTRASLHRPRKQAVGAVEAWRCWPDHRERGSGGGGGGDLSLHAPGGVPSVAAASPHAPAADVGRAPRVGRGSRGGWGSGRRARAGNACIAQADSALGNTRARLVRRSGAAGGCGVPLHGQVHRRARVICRHHPPSLCRQSVGPSPSPQPPHSRPPFAGHAQHPTHLLLLNASQ